VTSWERLWCARRLQEHGVRPTAPVADTMAWLVALAHAEEVRLEEELQGVRDTLAQAQQDVARATIGTAAGEEDAQRGESLVLRQLRKLRRELALCRGLVDELRGCRELPVEAALVHGVLVWRTPWRVLIQR
jgi:hypothetical protein